MCALLQKRLAPTHTHWWSFKVSKVSTMFPRPSPLLHDMSPPSGVVDLLQMHDGVLLSAPLAKWMNMRSFFVRWFERESVTVDVSAQDLRCLQGLFKRMSWQCFPNLHVFPLINSTYQISAFMETTVVWEKFWIQNLLLTIKTSHKMKKVITWPL